MKLHELLKVLKRVENKSIEVELHVGESTYTLDSIKEVKEYNFEDASSLQPTLLLNGSE